MDTSSMFHRIRRSFRRKKAVYCVNCGHIERNCYHGDYENVVIDRAGGSGSNEGPLILPSKCDEYGKIVVSEGKIPPVGIGSGWTFYSLPNDYSVSFGEENVAWSFLSVFKQRFFGY